jgi:hypothetical protein
MKINFTKKQYIDLLKLTHLGDWMANAHRIPGEEEEKFRDILQHIHSHAKEFGCDDLVEKGKGDDAFYATQKLYDETMGIVDEYDDENFWNELIERLTDRDFFDRYGVDGIAAMSGFPERMEKRDPFEDKYADEFEAHGIGRLEINKKS